MSRRRSRTAKCCRCEINTMPIGSADLAATNPPPCRCVPCFVCVRGDFYGTNCDSDVIVPYTRSQTAKSGYYGVVACGSIGIDYLITFESDTYTGECVLVLSSHYLGATDDGVTDNRLKHYFGPYDQPCRLLSTSPISFAVDAYGFGPGTITIARANFLDSPMDRANCGPTSDPYRCLCKRARITRETWDAYGNSIFEHVTACYAKFPYPSTQYGWIVDFDGDGGYAPTYIYIDSRDPLVFGMYGPYYDPATSIPDTAQRTVRCVTPYDPTANMQADWEVTTGPYHDRMYNIHIESDSHFHKFHCCRCWVECLCLTWVSAGCITRGVVCMNPPSLVNPSSRTWSYSLPCTNGYDATGTIALICKCEDGGRPHLVLDGDESTSILVECPLLRMPGTVNNAIKFYKGGSTLIVEPLRCGEVCPNFVACCGRNNLPRILYAEVLSEAICGCDIAANIVLVWKGDSSTEPGSSLYEGEAPFPCKAGVKYKLRLVCSGGMYLELLEYPCVTGPTRQEPQPGSTCDPLNMEFHFEAVDRPCGCFNGVVSSDPNVPPDPPIPFTLKIVVTE